MSRLLLLRSPVLQCFPSPSHNSVQFRSKHSTRQVKRLFKNNPATARVNARNGVRRHQMYELDPPTYQPVQTPKVLTNGWSEPVPPGSLPEYPFAVRRTQNKPNDAIGFLPVYAKFRKDGTKATTLIKKVTGDRDAFLKELRAVLELPKPKNEREDKIRIRTGGGIEVDGNQSRKVKEWLTGLGF